MENFNCSGWQNCRAGKVFHLVGGGLIRDLVFVRVELKM